MTDLDRAPGEGLLSIGELEARTGVPGPTLRSWERRLGFPTPLRSTGGQRRYREDDVHLVSRVQAERDRGLSLSAAVAAVRRGRNVGSGSLFARLRAEHPQLDVLRVGFSVMRNLTSAIEDECLAQASRPALFGVFQDVRSFRTTTNRWGELARSAMCAIAFSDFATTDGDISPAQVALPAASPMLNEWCLVCHDPRLSVALVAWELPRLAGDAGSRRFEALLTLDPEVVRDAALHCIDVAVDAGLGDLDGLVTDLGAGVIEDPRRSASLLRRFVLYADG